MGWKSEILKFRIDAADRAELTVAANRDGASGMSEWLRAVAIAAARRQPVYSADELDALAALRIQLLASNALMNQIARSLAVQSHTGDSATRACGLSETIRQISDIHGQLCRILHPLAR